MGPSQSTNTESSKVLPAPARNPEVSEKVICSTRPKVAPGTAHGKHETPSSSDERGKCQKVGNKRRFVEIKNRIFSALSNILFNNFSIFNILSNKNSFVHVYVLRSVMTIFLSKTTKKISFFQKKKKKKPRFKKKKKKKKKKK